MNDEVQLSEDMVRIQVALFCIERIAPESIAPLSSKGWSDRANVLHALKDWHSHARKKLHNEFLKV